MRRIKTVSRPEVVHKRVLLSRMALPHALSKADTLQPSGETDSPRCCPVCFEYYDAAARFPVVLPCQHKICAACCRKLVSLSGRGRCPLDRAQFSGDVLPDWDKRAGSLTLTYFGDSFGIRRPATVCERDPTNGSTDICALLWGRATGTMKCEPKRKPREDEKTPQFVHMQRYNSQAVLETSKEHQGGKKQRQHKGRRGSCDMNVRELHIHVACCPDPEPEAESIQPVPSLLERQTMSQARFKENFEEAVREVEARESQRRAKVADAMGSKKPGLRDEKETRCCIIF